MISRIFWCKDTFTDYFFHLSIRTTIRYVCINLVMSEYNNYSLYSCLLFSLYKYIQKKHIKRDNNLRWRQQYSCRNLNREENIGLKTFGDASLALEDQGVRSTKATKLYCCQKKRALHEYHKSKQESLKGILLYLLTLVWIVIVFMVKVFSH